MPTHSGLLTLSLTVQRVPSIRMPSKKSNIAIGGIAIPLLILLGVIYLVVGRSSTSSLTPAASVLDAGYAKSIGFPKTLQAAKKTKVTTQKGCTDSVESVYEDAGAKTGLLADVLNCNSEGSAAVALAAARKQVTVDRLVQVPSELGKTAFATASDAPEYLIAWQVGTRLVFTAIDVDLKASLGTGTGKSLKTLTVAQKKTLAQAAVDQNSLVN
jgi:hypothetical protein